MDNIYIVGFMGTGKTSVGKLLAEALSREFIEMDALIEQDQGKAIANIFAEQGEAHFRKLEKKLLKELALKADLVVSCGGGLVCDSDNLSLLKESGILVCLSASSQVINRRTKNHTHRPILNVEDPLKKIEQLLLERKPYYDQADHTVDTDQLSLGEVVDKLKTILDSSENNG